MSILGFLKGPKNMFLYTESILEGGRIISRKFPTFWWVWIFRGADFGEVDFGLVYGWFMDGLSALK